MRATTRLFTSVLVAAVLTPIHAVAAAPTVPRIAAINTWAVKTIPVPANDLAYDVTRDVLLAAVPTANESLGNELVELDPETGDIGRHVFVGSNPGPIALTDDGTTAYVALKGVNRVARVDLATFTLQGSFSTGADSFFGPRYVEDIDAVPGRNDMIVASLFKPGFSPRHEGVWVFEDGVALPSRTQTHTGADRIELANATTVYGYNNETTEFGLRTITLSAAGATETSAGPGAITGFGVDIEYALGRLYSTSGLIVDPVTRAAIGSFAGTGLIEVTPADNRVTVLNGTQVSVFNAATGQPIESRAFPQLTTSPTALIASGTGFAVAGTNSMSLLGPAVGGGPVTLPPPATSTLGGLNYVEVTLSAAAIEYDDVRRRVYASVPSSAAARANQVVALDPSTGEVLASVFVGSNPGPMAITGDRSALYVGLSTTGQIAKIDLATFLSVGAFSLGTSYIGGPEVAEDIEVRPGTTDTLAVSMRNTCCSPRHDGDAVFVAGVRLPDVTPVHTGANRIEFADATNLYGTNNETTGFEFYRMVVDGMGVHRTATTGYLLPGFGTDIELTGGTVYATNGMVVEPATSALTGRLPAAGPLEAVPAAQRIYFADGFVLKEFDLAKLRPVNTMIYAPSSSATALAATDRGFALALSGGKVGLLARPVPTNARYNPLTPARILDTRFGTGAPMAKVGPGATLDVQVTGVGGVPASGVSAVVLNVTALNASTGSFLTAWPSGTPRPLASNLNYVAGQTVPNLVKVKVGANGKVSLYNHAGLVDLAADVAGWYGQDGAPTGSRYNPLVPARVLDTRVGTGAPTAKVGPGASIDVQVTGVVGVPASGVSAVVLNVTAINASSGSFLTAWPAGLPRPLASNLNYVTGQTVSNLVVVKVGASGRVSLYNHDGLVDLGADVAGWYGQEADSTGARYSPLPPARILDTRFGTGAPLAKVGPAGTIDVRVTGEGGVPASGVSAVVLNVTVVDPTAPSFLTAWPAGLPRPTAANLNYPAGLNVPNLVVVKVGAGGKVSLYNHGGSTHMAADVAGWFTDE